MSDKFLTPKLIEKLEDLFYNFTPLELMVFFRKLQSSWLRECNESSLPVDYDHVSVIMDNWFYILELAVEQSLQQAKDV